MKFNNQPIIQDNQAIYTVNNFDLPTYDDFIKIRTLPNYNVSGNQILFNPEYVEGYLQNRS